ncbi:MAG TPA: hypothetical protein VFX59_01045 [Polyangiales bacterium]|nr:hypothetical protein [Polyangiales bacterium]
MGIVVLANTINVDDVVTFAMAISLLDSVAHVDDGHRRARTRRHQPAWAATQRVERAMGTP